MSAPCKEQATEILCLAAVGRCTCKDSYDASMILTWDHVVANAHTYLE